MQVQNCAICNCGKKVIICKVGRYTLGVSSGRVEIYDENIWKYCEQYSDKILMELMYNKKFAETYNKLFKHEV